MIRTQYAPEVSKKKTYRYTPSFHFDKNLQYSIMASLEACPALSDDTFGPTLPSGCGRKFDFTLLFEECALSLFPAAIFLLLLPFRLFALSKQRRVVGGNLLNYIKLVCCFGFQRATRSLKMNLNANMILL